jgi:hypothetical protein
MRRLLLPERWILQRGELVTVEKADQIGTSGSIINLA